MAGHDGASQNAVSGQLLGHRGGGIDLSFVRVADDATGGAGDVSNNAVYGRQRPLSFTTWVGKVKEVLGALAPKWRPTGSHATDAAALPARGSAEQALAEATFFPPHRSS